MGEFEKGDQGSFKMVIILFVVLFNLLLQNVYEGYFCDFIDGGNKGMVFWKMIGFFGVCVDYYDWVDQYGCIYFLFLILCG